MVTGNIVDAKNREKKPALLRAGRFYKISNNIILSPLYRWPVVVFPF